MLLRERCSVLLGCSFVCVCTSTCCLLHLRKTVPETPVYIIATRTPLFSCKLRTAGLLHRKTCCAINFAKDAKCEGEQRTVFARTKLCGVIFTGRYSFVQVEDIRLSIRLFVFRGEASSRCTAVSHRHFPLKLERDLTVLSSRS